MSSASERAPRQAALVIDLGFGDGGKGLLTDHLTRQLRAHTVVRFNGGGQAGHRVVNGDGRDHVCSHFAAGVFVPGVELHLSRWCAVHPPALLREAAALEAGGLGAAFARLTIAASAPLVTPFHQATNRLRELARGARRHGSCGLGVGETFRDVARAPSEVPRAELLADERRLLAAAVRAQESKRVELAALVESLRDEPAARPELELLERPQAAREWVAALAPLRAARRVVADDWLAKRLALPGAVVFEGAQGVLLDEWRGFHPYTTWSTCTFDQALELLAEAGYDGWVRRHGVTRCFATRHGAGPFPTEAPSLMPVLPEAHNGEGPWQGEFRRGWLDFVLLRYALEVCGGVDELTVTHADALARLLAGGFTQLLVATAYRGAPAIPRLVPGPFRDLEYQERLTEGLLRARPELRSVSLEGAGEPARAARLLRDLFEAELALRISRTAHGPQSAAVRED